jgi:hypothetical protein
MKDLFLDPKGAFGIEQENYITVEMEASFPKGFGRKIKQAVNKIKSEKDPTLIVAIHSHGSKGKLKRQNQESIPYEKLLDLLFEKTFSVNKDIKIVLFIESCFSGSIIPIIKEKLSCTSTDTECLFEGSDGGNYKSRVSVYTSAPDNQAAFFTEFWDVLNYVSMFDEYKDKENSGLNRAGILAFLSLEIQGDGLSNIHNFWSSYTGCDDEINKLVNDPKSKVSVNVTPPGELMREDIQNDHKQAEILPLILYNFPSLNDADKKLAISTAIDFLKDTNKAFREYSAFILGLEAIGNKDVIDALSDVIKTDTEANVRKQAVMSLGNIAKGDETAINALSYVIKNDKDANVRMEAVTSLQKIVQKNDNTAIETLSYALKNDNDDYVKWFSILALTDLTKENKDVADLLIHTLKSLKKETMYSNSLVVAIGKISPKGYAPAIEVLKHTIKYEKDTVVVGSANEALQLLLIP